MIDSQMGQVNNFLRRAIASGEARPGEVISANELARQLGVSRTPVRDALNQLAVEGLVDLRLKAGAVVRTMTLEQYEESAGLRTALEPYAAESAAARITYDETARLKKIVKEMGRLSRIMIDQNYPSQVCRDLRRLDDDFHRLVHEACGNRKVRKVIEDSKLLAVRQAYPSRREVAAVAATLREHWRIAKALETGDAPAARLWMTRHLERGGRDAIDAYRDYLDNLPTTNGSGRKAALDVARFGS